MAIRNALSSKLGINAIPQHLSKAGEHGLPCSHSGWPRCLILSPDALTLATCAGAHAGIGVRPCSIIKPAAVLRQQCRRQVRALALIACEPNLADGTSICDQHPRSRSHDYHLCSDGPIAAFAAVCAAQQLNMQLI